MTVDGLRGEGHAGLDAITFELVDENEAGAAQRALIGDLLVEAFGWRHRPKTLATALRRRSAVRERGYTLHRPHYRVLAWAGDRLVGTRMVCLPSCDPGLRLYGFGDVAVHPAWQRRGIAQAMTRLAVDEAVCQGADVMLTSTTKLERVYRECDFRPVRGPDEVRLEQRGGHSFLRTWLIRWSIEPTPIVLHSEF
jgi:GNAT superfamily N-acetyltransferase